MSPSTKIDIQIAFLKKSNLKTFLSLLEFARPFGEHYLPNTHLNNYSPQNFQPLQVSCLSESGGREED